MKLHCHRPSLAAAFQIVSGVVPTRTPKDILRNVKLHVADGKAILIGTDQEVGIRYEIPGVETDSAGEALLQTGRVISILRELTDDTLELEVTEEAVRIKSGHSRFQLSAADPAEFPPVPSFTDEQYHVIPGEALKKAVGRTLFATDVESTRYALGGVLLELGPESANLVATDSRRLAVARTPCTAHGIDKPENPQPVVPRTAMSLIEKSVADDEDVLIAVHANDVLLKSGHTTVYSRLVEGRFPRYADVIPREGSATADLVVGPFHAAVRQAQIVTDTDSRGVDFAFGDGTLTLDSAAADVGTSHIELPVAYEGNAVTIKFDPRYIAEFLRVLEAERSVKLSLIDSESAAVFRTDDHYTYVIMPLSREP
ncbi:MAG: DNA polymerase III subunit beta [Planctomycetes bacterium]|nr:DNA polymerase III subunit beta [Planctomycetota bacterium]